MYPDKKIAVINAGVHMLLMMGVGLHDFVKLKHFVYTILFIFHMLGWLHTETKETVHQIVGIAAYYSKWTQMEKSLSHSCASLPHIGAEYIRAQDQHTRIGKFCGKTHTDESTEHQLQTEQHALASLNGLPETESISTGMGSIRKTIEEIKKKQENKTLDNDDVLNVKNIQRFKIQQHIDFRISHARSWSYS